MYGPQKVYNEMVDVVYEDDGHYESLMEILLKTLNGKEVV